LQKSSASTPAICGRRPARDPGRGAALCEVEIT
jgi:hypothetical protein